jgi:hypothetical protein
MSWTGVQLSILIQEASDVRAYQVSGGPILARLRQMGH